MEGQEAAKQKNLLSILHTLKVGKTTKRKIWYGEGGRRWGGPRQKKKGRENRAQRTK